MPASSVPAGYRVEPMLEDDLDTILEIERASFSEEPWTRGMFQRELRIPFATSWIARQREAPGRILGYVCWRRLGDEWEILNLAVHPDARQQGIGRGLVLDVIECAKREGGRKIHLEARDDNTNAISLYRSCEFLPTGLRRHYYGRDHHALLMTWSTESEKCAGANVDKGNCSD